MAARICHIPETFFLSLWCSKQLLLLRHRVLRSGWILIDSVGVANVQHRSSLVLDDSFGRRASALWIRQRCCNGSQATVVQILSHQAMLEKSDANDPKTTVIIH